MSKQEQIEELKKALVDAHADGEKAWLKVANLRKEAAARDERERTAKDAKAALDKFQADDETIRRIEQDGLIPVTELRNAWHQTNSGHDGISIEFRFRPDAGQGRVRAAVLNALMGIERKPKFATGGYVGDKYGVAGLVNRGDFLPGGYYPKKPWFVRAAADGGSQWDRTDATPLSEAELDAVRRSADKLSEGSFRVVWGNDL